MEFFEPPLRITMAPPHSVLIFYHSPPPQTVIFGVTPPFKRNIIIIKPDMHIFCSVHYDWYFLFNVTLLTTHPTDVAATSVNSKSKFCPLAEALLHYFSNIKKYRESKERKVNFRFMDLPESVVAGLSTSSSSSIKARMASSPPELMESLSFLSLSSFSLLLYSSSNHRCHCLVRILYQLNLFLSVVFAALMDQGLQDSFREANALRLPSPFRS